jgi:hypothetical protein
MRRYLLLAILSAGVVSTSVAGAGRSPLQQRASDVRYAIPAAMAFQADHGTWRGMTAAKLQREYYAIPRVAVARAGRDAFCLESTKEPFVHFDGPVGNVRRGRCGTNGVVVPFVAEPTKTPTKTPAQRRISAAVPAIEAYAADHRGYAGMTIAALRRYDSAVSRITVARANRNTYCVESGSGRGAYHKDGPGAVSARGPCPAR